MAMRALGGWRGSPGGRGSVAGVLCAVAIGLAASPAAAQIEETSPVYISDAPLAEETLGTLDALLARGGADEAVRLLQRILEEQGERLVGTDEPGLFVSVRQRVHERIRTDAALLEAYRVRQTPRARVLLTEGRWADVARASWLTEPGFEAALRSAQTQIESARFAPGVRVLEELLDHPDAGRLAGEAAGLAASAASYHGTEHAWSVADAWAERAGRPAPERRRIEPPATETERVVRSLDWSGPRDGPVSLDGIVARALHSGELTEMDPSDQPEPVGRGGGMQRVEMSWVLPTLSGGDLFTNDGLTLTCFDRFTMRVKWRLRESTATEDGTTRQTRSRLGRIVEDSGTVAVDADRVYAAMGLARSVTDESTGRVVCVDRTTGRVRWSVVLGEMDESLRGAEPRGPIVVDGDTVVVGARKNLRSRRLVGLSLVGLDAHTGELRWTRALGSAGSLPFQQLTQLAEGGVLADGVVYWTDKVGLVGAVETATGRVRWVRQTRAPGLYTRGVRTPYTTSIPVINDHGLFVLTPDQTQILRLDPRDGTLLDFRAAQPGNDAAYLVGLDADRFASVGARRVAFYDASDFGEGDARVSPDLDERGLRGRAVAAGGRLAVPVGDGVLLIEPTGAMRTERIELDATGNILLDEGQAVVVDEVEARSFLSWETASAMLERRIESGDIASALALAELAQRSGREDRVIGAIDDAVRLARRAGDGGVWQQRVFDTVRRLADPDAGGTPAGTGIRGALLDRMGQVASTDEQRVAHAMAAGAWRAATGDAPGAAAAYAEILLDRDWSRSIWRGGGLTVRAELEATRRLHELADRFGSRATSTAERMARAEADALADAGTPAQWETLARRYPATRLAPAAWARAAAGWLVEERFPTAERAARTGLRAAQRSARRGHEP
ncbi:MAG: PQQ-binding-like beta-propeller repeat protein, partial [Phycisphaerales bacterium]|nr:PQQ-binding-like beta-propeller repeat protein [Phycisphaerales bacterium]